MVKYKVFEGKIAVDGHEYDTYGIEAVEISGNECKTILRIHDITQNREEVRSLCDKCNKHKLSVMHLKEICEDFLCEHYSGV